MLPEGWKEASLHYDAKNKIVHIGVKQEEILPMYLKYVLEYKGIPEDVHVVLLDGEYDLQDELKKSSR